MELYNEKVTDGSIVNIDKFFDGLINTPSMHIKGSRKIRRRFDSGLPVSSPNAHASMTKVTKFDSLLFELNALTDKYEIKILEI